MEPDKSDVPFEHELKLPRYSNHGFPFPAVFDHTKPPSAYLSPGMREMDINTDHGLPETARDKFKARGWVVIPKIYGLETDRMIKCSNEIIRLCLARQGVDEERPETWVALKKDPLLRNKPGTGWNDHIMMTPPQVYGGHRIT